MFRQSRSNGQRRGPSSRERDCALAGLVAVALATLLLRDATPAVHIVVAVLALLSAVAVWAWDDLIHAGWWDRTPDFANAHQADLEGTPATRWTLPTSCPGWPSARPLAPRIATTTMSPPISIVATPTQAVMAVAASAERNAENKVEEKEEVAIDPVTLAPIRLVSQLHED